METSSKQIINLRKKLGLTQTVFAEKIGFSQSYIRDIELGKAKPSRNILESINKVFKVSIDWILFGGSIKERAKIYLELISRCLIDDSKGTPKKKKKLYDHLNGIPDLSSYEIAFYVHKLLKLYKERDIDIKILWINNINCIVETPNFYHAFLGTPESVDQYAIDVIVETVNTTYRKHGSLDGLNFPDFKEGGKDDFLEVQNNKFYFKPLKKFYEPSELFEIAGEDNFVRVPSWHYTPRGKVRENIKKYFEDIDPDQNSPIIVEKDEPRITELEFSVIKILRSFDDHSLKDFYLYIASKGDTLAKKERDKINKDISSLKKAIK